jgi:hypothetical protein
VPQEFSLEEMNVNPFLTFKIFSMFENFTNTLSTDIDRVGSNNFNLLDIMKMKDDKLHKNIFKMIEQNKFVQLKLTPLEIENKTM